MLKVHYCPVFIEDMLSRAYLHEQSSAYKTDYQIFRLQQQSKLYKEIEELDPASHVRISENGLASLKEETIKDDSLSELKRIIHQGWLDLKQKPPLSIRAFWPNRDELVEDIEIIFKGTKVLVSNSMRTLMPQRSHSSYRGPEACVRRARDVIFWPGMTNEIRHLAS